MVTENEIKFMEFMEEKIIPNRNPGVSFDDIRYAASLIGYSITGSCGSCMKNYGIDLLNLYGTIEPRWIEHKKGNEWIPIHLRKKNKKV